MFLVFVLVTLLALLTWLLREPLFAEWRRARIRRQPFPPEWRQALRARVPYFQRMPADLQLQLKKRMQVFLAEKPFIGCAGLVVTDEMRVTIAAQACLLILNRRTDHFANLRQVLVYPGAFVVDKVRADAAGVAHERRDTLAGESWSLGQVILSWQDTIDGASVSNDGCNVVIHEFAHQLDQANGPANGAPHLPSRARRARGQRVLGAEFQAMRKRAAAGEASLLNDYGAVDPAEFFAVASEVFFEQPDRLAAEHPALYRELSGLYCVNPLSW